MSATDLRKPAVLSLTAPLALTLALSACKGKGEEPEASKDEAAVEQPAADDGKAPTADDDGQAGAPTPGEEADDPRAVALTIARAEAPASTGAKGVKSLGVSLEKITHLFALAATAKVPRWGAAGEGEAKLSRDDDLDTAWRCSFSKDAAQPCVLGLALPEKAKVEVVRLYSAAGPRYRDYTAHPRIARVRVHTDAGFVEADVADGANHAYVRFDAPIETQSLAIEVLEVHAGKKDALLHIAEVEIYGTDGSPRAPIEFDPGLAWASWETDTWSGEGDYTIRQVFIDYVPANAGQRDAKTGPARKRLTRATAVFGQAGDDFLLFERLHGSDCEEHAGSYLLFDRRNRMFYPLADLGGAGGQVYRHHSGRGFAVGWISEGSFTVKGVVEEAGELKWRRPPKQAPEDPQALLRQWGFDPTPLSRGDDLEAPPVGCHRGGAGELDPMLAVAKLPSGGELDPSRWLVCELGSAKLYTQGTCGSGARAYLIDQGKLLGKHEGKPGDDRGFRLRRVGEAILLELSEAGGASSRLVWVEADKFVELAAAGGLAVRPPAGCRACEDDWHGEGDMGEGETEDELEGTGLDEDMDDDAHEDEDHAEPEDEAEDAPDQDGPTRPTAPTQPAPPMSSGE